MEHHHLAGIIPAMTDAEYADLKRDISANGLRNPILIYEGKILDGRHRERACHELGVALVTETFEGDLDGALREVLTLNLHRRHLTPEQRADLLAPHVKTKRGRPKNAPSGAFTIDKAAAAADVSRRTMQRAVAKTKKGEPKQKRERAAPKHPLWADAASAEALKTLAEAEGKTLKVKATEVIDAAVAGVSDGLALTAKAKLETAIRVRTKQLEAEFEARVSARMQELWDEGRRKFEALFGPKIKEANQIREAYRGVMTEEQYKLLRLCLHPDTSLSPEKKAEGFRTFNELQIKLLPPADPMPVPDFDALYPRKARR